MLFKDVKTGYTIYILHKTDEPFVSQGKVTTQPTTHINNVGQFPSIPNAAMQMMVDVTIEDNGVTKTYTMPENSSITYANDLVLAVERDLLIREVESQKSASQEHIRMTPVHEKRVESYDKILTDLNPVFREKKENEERFGKIENEIKSLANSISSLVSKLS